MNTKLLLKVKARILKHPASINMRHYANSCGTTGCIAGHAMAIGNKVSLWTVNSLAERDLFRTKAKKLLDLTEDQYNRLCFPNKWPDDFYKTYNELVTDYVNDKLTTDCYNNKMAQLVADYIDHFIKTETVN